MEMIDYIVIHIYQIVLLEATRTRRLCQVEIYHLLLVPLGLQLHPDQLPKFPIPVLGGEEDKQKIFLHSQFLISLN